MQVYVLDLKVDGEHFTKDIFKNYEDCINSAKEAINHIEDLYFNQYNIPLNSTDFAFKKLNHDNESIVDFWSWGRDNYICIIKYQLK